MSNTFFIPAQGNHIMAEQNRQKKDVNYAETPFILLKEKFNSLKPLDGINNIINRNGKNNLEALNLFHNSKEHKQDILNATVEQLEIQKDINNNEHKNILQDKINAANKKIIKPKYE